MQILYNNPMFRLKNNNWLSKTCSMQRGIRQGCPVSAILFLFVVEVLSIKIRQNEEIKGFTKDGMTDEVKIIQHADDCTLPLKDKKSLKVVIHEIEIFSKFSGMKLNLSKTECILLGHLKGRYKKIEGVTVNESCVKTLGIYVGHNKKMCYDNNWTKTVNDIEKLFESWKKRKLTIFGKVCVINTLAISKLIYVASILEFPDENTIKLLNTKFFQFLWNKRDRIKRNTLIGSICNGGIKIVDIESKIKALKASWTKKLNYCENSLKDFLNSFCAKHNVDFQYILHTNLTKIHDYGLAQNFPAFYREIFMFFNMCKATSNLTNISLCNFLRQPLWCNKLITYKGKSLLFENWSRSGLRYVSDIVDQNGLKPLEWFYDTLRVKNNILYEYKIMLHIFKHVMKVFSFQDIVYQNVKMTSKFDFIARKCVDISEITSKFLYEMFVQKKFHIPIYQSFLSRTLNIERSSWTSIYSLKVKEIFDKKVAEFNFKLLNNLLCNNIFLRKIKKSESDLCQYCKAYSEDNEHLIFNCDNVNHIWKLASKILKFEIQWKHILIGFYFEKNQKIIYLNNIISTIATIIYKYKMYCRLKDKEESKDNISIHVKGSLKTYSCVYKRLKHNMCYQIFEKISNILQICSY